MKEQVPENDYQEQVLQWLLGWLESRSGHYSEPTAPLFNGVLDSLGLLEMLAACHEACALSLPINRLQLADLETAESFAAAAARLGEFGKPRDWYQFQWSELASLQRMALLLKLRAQLPSELVVQVSDEPEKFKIGALRDSHWDERQLRSLVHRCLST